MRRLAIRFAFAVAAIVLAPGSARGAVVNTEIGTYDLPVHVASPPGDISRIFVVEQNGTIRVRVNGIPGGAPFLDIQDIVSSPADNGEWGERGLLSIAFPPDYASTRRFYVFFTQNDGDLEVAEYLANASNPDVADEGTHRKVLEIPHPGQDNHNGGQLAFDALGYLFISTGDGGGGGDPDGNAQNLGTLLGKILRIDPRQSGGAPYTVPGGPFVSGARPEVWSYGLRNPFRFSLDRLTGDMIIGDVGQGRWEEVDYVPAMQGAGAGRNFGWDACEGPEVFNQPGTPCNLVGSTPPVWWLDSTNIGYCSVIGGFVSRDRSLAELAGAYLYSDFCKGELERIQPALPFASGRQRVGSFELSAMHSFGEDACGRIYMAAGSNVTRLEDGSSSCVSPLPLPASPNPAGGPAIRPTPVVGAASVSGTAKKRQRALKAKGIKFTVTCSTTCSLKASATIRGTARKALKPNSRRVRSFSGRKTYKIALSKKARKRIRTALKRKRKVTARLRIEIKDSIGKRTVTRPLVRITG